MQRTPEAIREDMKVARSAGCPPMGAKMRALRAELKEAEGASSAPPSPAPAAAPTPFAETVGAVSAFDADFEKQFAQPARSPYDSDEWRFIEKCAAELASRTDGMSTGRVKKAYNDLELKVRLWRIAREIVLEVGVGAEWPQWTALQRDESTGKKVEKKPAVPAPAPAAAPAATAATPIVPPGESILAAASGAPSTDGMARAIAAEIAGAMRNRVMPQGTPAALAGAPA